MPRRKTNLTINCSRDARRKRRERAKQRLLLQARSQENAGVFGPANSSLSTHVKSVYTDEIPPPNDNPVKIEDKGCQETKFQHSTTLFPAGEVRNEKMERPDVQNKKGQSKGTEQVDSEVPEPNDSSISIDLPKLQNDSSLSIDLPKLQNDSSLSIELPKLQNDSRLSKDMMPKLPATNDNPVKDKYFKYTDARFQHSTILFPPRKVRNRKRGRPSCMKRSQAQGTKRVVSRMPEPNNSSLSIVLPKLQNYSRLSIDMVPKLPVTNDNPVNDKYFKHSNTRFQQSTILFPAREVRNRKEGRPSCMDRSQAQGTKRVDSRVPEPNDSSLSIDLPKLQNNSRLSIDMPKLQYDSCLFIDMMSKLPVANDNPVNDEYFSYPDKRFQHSTILFPAAEVRNRKGGRPNCMKRAQAQETERVVSRTRETDNSSLSIDMTKLQNDSSLSIDMMPKLPVPNDNSVNVEYFNYPDTRFQHSTTLFPASEVRNCKRGRPICRKRAQAQGTERVDSRVPEPNNLSLSIAMPKLQNNSSLSIDMMPKLSVPNVEFLNYPDTRFQNSTTLFPAGKVRNRKIEKPDRQNKKVQAHGTERVDSLVAEPNDSSLSIDMPKLPVSNGNPVKVEYSNYPDTSSQPSSAIFTAEDFENITPLENSSETSEHIPGNATSTEKSRLNDLSIAGECMIIEAPKPQVKVEVYDLTDDSNRIFPTVCSPVKTSHLRSRLPGKIKTPPTVNGDEVRIKVESSEINY